MQAYAGVKKFLGAINPSGPEPGLPAAQVPAAGVTYNAGQKAALERNQLAMYTLTLCLTNQGSMGFILKARTKEFPGGLAWMVMKFMRERYAPKDRISRIEMKRQLTAVKMGPKENPAIMFEEFHRLANLFNDPNNAMEISQDDFMAQVFIAAPDHYQSVLNSESRQHGANLTLAHLEQAMTQLWRATYGKDKDKESESESKEVVLANPA